MKKIITNLLAILFCSQVFGQITTRDISEKAVLKPRVYDSLYAFNPKEDLRIYIGQELYFLTKSQKRENFNERDIIGYSNFSNAPKDASNFEDRQYHPIQDGKYNFRSDYKEIAGKYFIVDDFLDQTDKNKYKYTEQGLYFKLINKQLRDTAYYQIAKVKGHLSDRMLIPFIVVGNFEKTKSIMVGEKLQLLETIKSIKEINTGQLISCEEGTWWECVDFTIVDLENNIYSKPVFIFRNEKFEEIAVEAEGYSALKTKRNQFMTPQEIEEERLKEELKNQKIEERLKREEEKKKKREKEWAENDKKFREECISEFGSKYGNYIADGKVIIGMNKKMCRLAWGSPININTTTTTYGISEQWVYSLKHYLYFENGKLTAIQN